MAGYFWEGLETGLWCGSPAVVLKAAMMDDAIAFAAWSVNKAGSMFWS